MHKIKIISRQILDEKLKESAVTAGDMHTKKDIMSLLVKARKAEEEAANGAEKSSGAAYRMSDDMMMNQVVWTLSSSLQ